MAQNTQLFLLFVASYLLLTWAMYLPFRAGLLYNGPVFCMAIGGYTAAWLDRYGSAPFLAALLLGAVAGGGFGYLPARAFARTSGIATAMGSIALIYIVQSILRNTPQLGGPQGIRGIPGQTYLVAEVAVLVLVVGVFLFRLEGSRFGRALEAVAQGGNLADAMGVDVRRTTVAVMTISSVLGALGGVVYSFSIGTVQPGTFGFELLLRVWTMLFIGGRYTMWGALISVPILWGLPQWLPSGAARYSNFVFGVLLILVILWRPQGLVDRPLMRRLARLIPAEMGRSGARSGSAESVPLRAPGNDD